MIKCEKCERPAEHLVIVSGLSSRADWPICDQCLIKNIMMKDRRMSFAEMEGYVNRYKKIKTHFHVKWKKSFSCVC